MLKATNIYKKYGSLEVLKGVDIEVQAGEVVSIVGSSGAGKSTLLHIVGTLDSADRGEISINGIDAGHLKGKALSSFRNKHIGFIFQFHHLLPEFTAIENVCIPGWIAGTDRPKVEAKAKELLDLLGLKDRFENKPNQLSGGEQQRVAVARALINSPAIVFADEPTGNLDSGHARELHQLFFDLRSQLKQTFLIVTHNEELADLSDRKLVMKDGKIVNQIETTDKLFETEKERQISLPKIYKDFYALCSISIPKHLVGTNLFNDSPDLYESAIELLEENNANFSLSDKAFVFLMHQGYVFCYFEADGNPNPDVYMYTEGKPIPEKDKPLSEFLNSYIN